MLSCDWSVSDHDGQCWALIGQYLHEVVVVNSPAPDVSVETRQSIVEHVHQHRLASSNCAPHIHSSKILEFLIHNIVDLTSFLFLKKLSLLVWSYLIYLFVYLFMIHCCLLCVFTNMYLIVSYLGILVLPPPPHLRPDNIDKNEGAAGL